MFFHNLLISSAGILSEPEAFFFVYMFCFFSLFFIMFLIWKCFILAKFFCLIACLHYSSHRPPKLQAESLPTRLPCTFSGVQRTDYVRPFQHY
jgi:hypothetical protein